MLSLTTGWKKARLLGLVFLVVALCGPWGYDQINVPAEYACQKPYIRLYGDFCGLPVSALGIIFIFGREVSAWVLRIITEDAGMGDLTAMLLLAAGVMVILAPIASFAWRLTRRGGHWLWWHVPLSAVAIVVSGIFLWQQAPSPAQLWGVWLYAAVLFMVLAAEAAAAIAQKCNPPAA